MNILLVTSFWGRKDGGLALSCQNFGEALAAHGHQVYVIASPDQDESKSKTFEINKKSEIPRIFFILDNSTLLSGGYRPDQAYHLRFSAFARQLKEQFSDLSPDLCIAFGAGLNGLFTAHLASKLNIPLIICLRGSDSNLSFSDLSLRMANRECFKSARAIVGLSAELVNNAKEIEPDSNACYYVIPNPADLPILCSQRPLQKGVFSKVVLGISSRYLNEKKGIGTAIKVLGQLIKKHAEYEWQLELIGQIDNDLQIQYEHLAISENVKHRITFNGLLDREQWLRNAKEWDASLQLSFFEGFSNTNIESWSIGVPVIFSDTGYIAEQLLSVIPELVLPWSSEEAIAEKIWSLFSEKDLAELSNKAIDLLKPLLNEKKVWHQWESVLKFSLDQKITIKPSQKIDWALPVLFHDVSKNEYSSVAIPCEQFEAFTLAIKNKGYSLCSVAEYIKNSEKSRCIICTFDDAYEGVYSYAYPILQKMGFTATVFVPTECIGHANDWNPKDPVRRKHLGLAQLTELYHSGWEIGSHGTQHISYLRLNKSEIDENLQRSKEELAQSFGKISSFAYPYGHYNELVQKQASLFYEYIFATENGGNNWLIDRDHIRRYSATEILEMIGA